MPLSSMTIGQTKLKELVEPEALALSSREWSITEVATLSAAISLLRIADNLQKAFDRADDEKRKANLVKLNERLDQPLPEVKIRKKR